MIVPYTYPHKAGLPDLDNVFRYADMYSRFYIERQIDFSFIIEVGEYDMKLIFKLPNRI
jgi:hypothetical protein